MKFGEEFPENRMHLFSYLPGEEERLKKRNRCDAICKNVALSLTALIFGVCAYLVVKDCVEKYKKFQQNTNQPKNVLTTRLTPEQQNIVLLESMTQEQINQYNQGRDEQNFQDFYTTGSQGNVIYPLK